MYHLQKVTYYVKNNLTVLICVLDIDKDLKEIEKNENEYHITIFLLYRIDDLLTLAKFLKNTKKITSLTFLITITWPLKLDKMFLKTNLEAIK